MIGIYKSSNVDLVQPPDVAVLVLLVFALDDLHLVLHRLLVEDGADQVGDEPGMSSLLLTISATSQRKRELQMLKFVLSKNDIFLHPDETKSTDNFQKQSNLHTSFLKANF